MVEPQLLFSTPTTTSKQHVDTNYYFSLIPLLFLIFLCIAIAKTAKYQFCKKFNICTKCQRCISNCAVDIEHEDNIAVPCPYSNCYCVMHQRCLEKQLNLVQYYYKCPVCREQNDLRTVILFMKQKINIPYKIEEQKEKYIKEKLNQLEENISNMKELRNTMIELSVINKPEIENVLNRVVRTLHSTPSPRPCSSESSRTHPAQTFENINPNLLTLQPLTLTRQYYKEYDNFRVLPRLPIRSNMQQLKIEVQVEFMLTLKQVPIMILSSDLSQRISKNFRSLNLCSIQNEILKNANDTDEILCSICMKEKPLDEDFVLCLGTNQRKYEKGKSIHIMCYGCLSKHFKKILCEKCKHNIHLFPQIETGVSNEVPHILTYY